MVTEKTDTQIEINWNEINDITNQRQAVAYTTGSGYKEFINDNTVQRKCISEFLLKYQKRERNNFVDHWLELFELRNPKIILYTRADGYRYCHIAPEYIEIMSRLVNSGL